MNTFMKRISVYLVAALISVGATYGTYKYLERAKPYSVADTYNYGNEFEQEGVQLASYTEDGYVDFTKAAEHTVHAVVHIKSVSKAEVRQGPQRVNPFEFFFGPGFGGGREYNYEPQPRIGSGSGVIISADGYILTNNHVIDKATELEVTLNDNRKFFAKIIGTDPQTDIALIKIEGKDFPYVPFGDSDKLKVGEWVLAVGNPFNLTSTVTKGIVSAKARGGIGGGSGDIQSFIQTDAAINPGNSGGALVNTKGELVGINTAIYSQTGNFAGYGFAVPISIAGKVAADLKEFGAVQRAMLGVTIVNINDARNADPKRAYDAEHKKLLEEQQELVKGIKLNNGVLVAGFADNSPAKEAGVKEKDVIIAVNGVKTPSVSVLQEQISRFRPGDKVKMEVDRDGKKISFDIILKNNEGTTSITKKQDGVSLMGAAFKELDKEKMEALGISYGVEVTGADSDGLFYKHGIRKGFVIQKINNFKVNTVAEVEQIITRAVNSSNEEDKALFITGITSTGKRVFLTIELK